MQPVLVLGGYGNFGKRIVGALVRSGIPTIIAGRSERKARDLKIELNSPYVDIACFDAYSGLEAVADRLNPCAVINTCGPFQTNDYRILEACLRCATNYVDLADGRQFVKGVSDYDARAKQAGISIISGASTVPALSSAVIEHYQSDFAEITHLSFGISPGQKAERGLATTQAIMSYVGKPFEPFPGRRKLNYGWQDIYRQNYPGLGKRWMANCDIPDLDLLPEKYGIETLQFSAGLELGALHLGLWGLSWLVRVGMPLNMVKFAALLLKASDLFNKFGSADGGMHVIMSGTDEQGEAVSRKWFVVALDGHGPHIPTVPAINLARRLARGENLPIGAMPCVGMIPLQDYLEELTDYNIKTYAES